VIAWRRRSGLYLVVAAAVVALTAAIALVAGNRGLGSSPDASPVQDLRFAEVQRTDLVATHTLGGAVTSGQGDPVINRLQGTLTAQAATGSRVERGDALYSVDGAPVTLFHGSLPAWRTLEEGVADGPDVRQLEENLAELGFSPGNVDVTFTSSTATAVRAWQSEVGLEPDGVVRVGQIVYLPGPVTVSQQTTSTGAPVRDGEPILRTQTDTKTVTATLEPDEQDLMSVGDPVTVTRAGLRLPSTVTSVESREAQTGQTTILATITPDDPTADPTAHWAAGDDEPGVAIALDPEPLLDAVTEARDEADVVVVYMHWGVQGESCPSDSQQELAAQLAAAGADVVVGSHTHRLQGAGMLDETYVAYGLGNSVWYSQSSQAASTTGVLTLTVHDGRVVEETWEPALIGDDGLPQFAEGAQAREMVRDFAELRGCTDLEPGPGGPSG
jgi:peptidoglycan hydrolase-like protein with peptidoglycan-binding domain